MILFIARRVASGVVLILAISFIAYNLLYLAAGDISRNILGEAATQEQVALKNAELGFDRPIILRYIEWLGHAVTGDLGRSYFTSESVSQALATRVPVTLGLLIVVTVLSGVSAVAIGVLAGVRRGWIDRVLQTISLLGYALPNFLIALFLVAVFALQLKLFPATGYTPFTESPARWLLTIALPALALCGRATATTAQQIRSSVIEVSRQDYVRTLRSRGMPEREIILKHVLRNAAAPGLTVLALSFVGLLGGAVIVEQIFALPGLGTMAVAYTTRGDIPVVMGLILVCVLIVIALNLLVDIGVGWLNPKARVR